MDTPVEKVNYYFRKLYDQTPPPDLVYARILRDTARNINTIALWLYQIGGKQIYDLFRVRKAGTYDFAKFGDRLPGFNRMSDALAWLHKYDTGMTFVERGVIKCRFDSDIMARGVAYMLADYDINATEKQRMPIKYLTGINIFADLELPHKRKIDGPGVIKRLEITETRE
jgi:hypothetical protein